MELVISNLTKDFHGFKAVNDISLEMEKGVYGLLGVNGAGKTTLMRMLCTLMHPTIGTISYNGKDIFKLDGEYRKILGYLPQEYGFYPDFSVMDYLNYIASIKGLRQSVARKRVKEVLHQVGMEQYKSRKMKKLSGGMKRRIGIAQAILNDPKILILDEPTAGLDPRERIRFRNLISELAQDRLVLLSTHIVSDIECVASKIFLMKDGSIELAGTAQELIDSVPVKAWRCMLSPSDADMIQRKYSVSNRRMVQGGVELRVISKVRPCHGAIADEMTLEDLFLYVFGEKAGDEDGEI
ncbi:MAG: ABC transporter ATP-binding protein [Lachnospiraceae bacterium]|nr:ABC transporter ATP-binding protein [Lachnospiraceae bacterium]